LRRGDASSVFTQPGSTGLLPILLGAEADGALVDPGFLTEFREPVHIISRRFV
jgi:hypothetical protein